MAIIYALDEQTGGTKWSFNTVQAGETPMAFASGTAYVPVANLSADYTASSGPSNLDFTTATARCDRRCHRQHSVDSQPRFR
jgi:hypothetical protein